VRGEVFDVAVDIRLGSPTFGKWMGVVLSAENKQQIFIPRGFAHGFAVVSEEAEFLYKCTDFYDPAGEYGVHWQDPQLAIDWGVTSPVVSAKDARYLRLNQVSPDLLPRYEHGR
jgi:dTDP-4-dehydrorhamnose 3,5-epimerase